MMFWKDRARKAQAKERTPRAIFPGTEQFAAKVHAAEKLGIGLAFVILAILLFPPSGISPGSEYREGAVSDKQIIAPFEFSVLKDDGRYEAEKKAAEDAVPPIFTIDSQQTTKYMARLAALRQAVVAHDEGRSRALNLSKLPDVKLSEETQAVLATPRTGVEVVEAVERFANQVLETGIVRTKRLAETAAYDTVRMKSEKFELSVPVASLLDKSGVASRALAEAAVLFSKSPGAASAFVEVAGRFVDVNAHLDPGRTAMERARARDAVSRFDGVVLQGEKIIGSHERITSEHIKKLRSLEYYKRDLGEKTSRFERSLPYASKFVITSLFLVVFWAYLHTRRRRILAERHMILLLAVTSLIVLALGSLVMNVLRLPPFLIPVALVPFLITLLLDDEVAFLAGIITTLMIATLAGLDLVFIVASLAAVTTGVYTVIGVRHRRQFYRSLLFVAAAYVTAIFAAGFGSKLPGSTVVLSAGYGILNSFVCVLAAMALLPVLESIFGLTTNIKLLELSDLNRPLLRKMMIEAPGTYHHSIVVGSLAEAAAEAIGANSLLARVGSYYHDIGKISKPEYYVENQRNARSRHDKLSPTMSCLILESHVREGVELAEQEKLPRVIRQLIKEHHGTSLMAFFYQKALEIDSDAPVDEFRYPGPKPSSKEAAIVMLADSVEAASRSLTSPTPSRIRGVVTRIVENRATEGELDECGLTMAELTKIRESFVPILISIFHARPSYPEDVKKKENGDIGKEQTEKDRYQY
ncbi:MAG: HDIG domain-containing protein [Candidatus Eisenbacteria bacterium]|nr:HDIG domain-containing protein [Candidatus Eisenbacteria bacterium]